MLKEKDGFAALLGESDKLFVMLPSISLSSLLVLHTLMLIDGAATENACVIMMTL